MAEGRVGFGRVDGEPLVHEPGGEGPLAGADLDQGSAVGRAVRGDPGDGGVQPLRLVRGGGELPRVVHRGGVLVEAGQEGEEPLALLGAGREEAFGGVNPPGPHDVLLRRGAEQMTAVPVDEGEFGGDPGAVKGPVQVADELEVRGVADGVQDGAAPGGVGGVPAEAAAAAPGVGGRVGPEAGGPSPGGRLHEGGQGLDPRGRGVLVDRPYQRGEGVQSVGERAAGGEHQSLPGVAAQDVGLVLLLTEYGEEVQGRVLGPEYRHDVDHGRIPSAERNRAGRRTGGVRPGSGELRPHMGESGRTRSRRRRVRNELTTAATGGPDQFSADHGGPDAWPGGARAPAAAAPEPATRAYSTIEIRPRIGVVRTRRLPPHAPERQR